MTLTFPDASDPTPAPQSPSLARVQQGSLCAGCGLCAGIAPEAVEMVNAPPGFLRPRQTAALSADQEAQIAASCPGLVQKVTADGRTDNPLWGPYVSMHTGWATDEALRFAGSSGGALSMLLVHLLQSGTVDAVVQTGPHATLPMRNATVVTTDLAGVTAAAGSRYAPSAPLSDLHAHLADGRRFAFVGKPCDVAALRAFQAQSPEAKRAFPVLLSFFCAGVPSHAGGLAVLDALGADPEQTTAFRYRGNGWPGQATATLQSGESRSMSYHDSWGGILSKHVQHRCKICADGTGVAADIVCADAWESDAAGYPLFDEADGVSLIVARTEQGARLLAEAQAAGRLVAEPFDVAKLAAIQPGQRERRRALGARLAALKLLGRPVPHYQGLQIRAAARQNSLKRNLRNFLGTLRRAIRGR